jgi:hypothetical protein
LPALSRIRRSDDEHWEHYEKVIFNSNRIVNYNNMY